VTASLEIRDLAAGYGRRRIWEQISFTACPGEILVLLGKNGSGKTTLLRAIQGSIPLQCGSVRIGGKDLSGLTVRRRAALVTTMPQEIPAERGLTGWDFVEMGLYPSRGPFAALTEKDRAKIQRTAEKFSAAALLDRDLAEMSVGERQMVSLLRAVLQDTPVLLLDEPASALDFGHTGILFRMLQRIAEEGKTILMVLHDPTPALQCGTRLLLLQDGGICADVPVDRKAPEAMETVLRRLYPEICVHDTPLFCYTETTGI